MPSLNASVLKGLNIDPQELYSFYDAIKVYDSYLLQNIAKAIIELHAHGVDAPDMVKRIDALSIELKNLEQKKENLDQETNSIEAGLQQ